MPADACPLLLGHQQPDSDGVIIIEGDASEVVGHDPSGQQAQQGQVIRPSSSQASLAHEEVTLLRHSFWGLFAIGAVTGLAGGFLTGATGVCVLTQCGTVWEAVLCVRVCVPQT